MLKKSERLSRSQFDQYFKNGRRYNSPALTVIYSPHKNFHGSVVVGKKVSKIAARRNRIRRRIYEQLRQQYKNTNVPGVFIVIVKPSFNSLTQPAAHAAVEELLYKITKDT